MAALVGGLFPRVLKVQSQGAIGSRPIVGLTSKSLVFGFSGPTSSTADRTITSLMVLTVWLLYSGRMRVVAHSTSGNYEWCIDLDRFFTGYFVGQG